jgi:hypothetical protein
VDVIEHCPQYFIEAHDSQVVTVFDPIFYTDSVYASLQV